MDLLSPQVKRAVSLRKDVSRKKRQMIPRRDKRQGRLQSHSPPCSAEEQTALKAVSSKQILALGYLPFVAPWQGAEPAALAAHVWKWLKRRSCKCPSGKCDPCGSSELGGPGLEPWLWSLRCIVKLVVQVILSQREEKGSVFCQEPLVILVLG